MNPLTLPFRLPFLPLTALVKLAEVLEQEAERELQADIRHQLEDAEYARETGQASDEEIAWAEEQAIRRLFESRQRRERS